MRSMGSSSPSPSKLPDVLKSEKDDGPKFADSNLGGGKPGDPMVGELKLADEKGEYPKLGDPKLDDEENIGFPNPEDENEDDPLDGAKDDAKFDAAKEEGPKLGGPNDDPKLVELNGDDPRLNDPKFADDNGDDPKLNGPKLVEDNGEDPRPKDPNDDGLKFGEGEPKLLEDPKREPLEAYVGETNDEDGRGFNKDGYELDEPKSPLGLKR
ncbi:hypothetical protein TNIN_100451 [Trichonephila inaurata madagascariensis]|uniref:Uncharacterized protein n=1 Tax=Trichonephila inaurata madagascariensis TaxID=2747483 RepID=A0A8X6KM90_9ARAC|nr:hypothetical protein TNIN_100451 [Trichonephila inaurata madagascariensis]